MAAVLVLFFFSQSFGQQPATNPSARKLPRGFVSKTIKMPSGREYKYAVFVPPQYQASGKHAWPLLVFLHGSGECGSDGFKHTTLGLPSYITTRPTRFPFITVMPQAQDLWFRGEQGQMVWDIMDAAMKDYRIDPDRLYLTGLSMGAFATWEFAMAHPDRFAAIVPVCGVGDARFASNIVNLPVWAFHGGMDRNVPVSGSRDPIQALRRLNAFPKYTEYPDLAHNCWDKAYDTPELWNWLLRQRRKPPPRVIEYKIPGGSVLVWWLGVVAENSLKSPGYIRAEVNEDGKISVESEGIRTWSLISKGPPLEPGMDIEVSWNGALIHRGMFKGVFSVEAQAPPAEKGPAMTTQPHARKD